ncbi:MAG: L-threonylcarbamoyladenylate synthase [Candidatus Peregrinibacteria bacterium]
MELLSADSKSIKRAVEVLRQGGVIAHPADTCFGLATDFTNPDAVKKIQAMKGRDGLKPMSIMLPAAFKDQLEGYAKLNAFTREICDKLLPGPITIVLPKGPKIPKWYFPKTKFIGIRIPYAPFTQDLLNAFKGALVTTSANASGRPICHTHKEVLEFLKKSKIKLDVLVQGTLPKDSLASTVIWPEKNQVRIVRKGPLTASQLTTLLGIPVVE